MKQSLVLLEVFENETIRYQGQACLVLHGIVAEAGSAAALFFLIINLKRKNVVKVALENHRLFPTLARNLSVIFENLDRWTQKK